MIVIIGASGGIGRYLAEEYSKRGERVIGTCFSQPLSPIGQPFLMKKVDARDYDEVSSFINAIEEVERADITLINCLGINYNNVAHKTEMDSWKDVVNTNLIGAFNAIRAVLPLMRNAGFGRIINFSSVVPQIGVIGTTAYSASKSGLWGLAKSLAAENASKNITINNINLGYFDVGMIKDVPDSVLNSIKDRIPAKRLGQATEIFDVVEMIRRIGYINGASIDVNGGF